MAKGFDQAESAWSFSVSIASLAGGGDRVWSMVTPFEKGTHRPVSLLSRRESLTLDSVIAGLKAAPALVSRAAGVASSGTMAALAP